jgi:hypothetical protein
MYIWVSLAVEYTFKYEEFLLNSKFELDYCRKLLKIQKFCSEEIIKPISFKNPINFAKLIKLISEGQ